MGFLSKKSKSGSSGNKILVAVMKEDNSLICMGYMSAKSSGEAIIFKKDNVLPVYTHGYPVKIKTMNQDSSFIFSGQVKSTSPDAWIISNLKVIKLKDDRETVREVMNIPGTVYYTVKNLGKEKTIKNTCTLIDISIGGACIDMSVNMPIGYIFKLGFTWNNEPYVLLCRVVRKIEKETCFEYGCRFICKESEEQLIARLLFEIQRKKRINKT